MEVVFVYDNLDNFEFRCAFHWEPLWCLNLRHFSTGILSFNSVTCLCLWKFCRRPVRFVKLRKYVMGKRLQFLQPLRRHIYQCTLMQKKITSFEVDARRYSILAIIRKKRHTCIAQRTMESFSIFLFMALFWHSHSLGVSFWLFVRSRSSISS